MSDETNRLRGQIAKLREALRGFAEYYDCGGGDSIEQSIKHWFDDDEFRLASEAFHETEADSLPRG